MEILDKSVGKEKRESLELAEESREKEWTYPSFVLGLFQGKLAWNLIYPFPEQSEEDKRIGDEYLQKLKDFLQTHLDPEKVDQTGKIPDEVIKGLTDLGAFTLKIPKVYGGRGLSQVNYNRAIHLVASYCGSTAVLLSAHQSIGVPQPLLLFGTEEQKEKFLPRFCQGAISGFALTESEAGSDPRSMKTTATPIEEGRYYLINGEKLWCSNGNIADILVVMCQTPPKIERGKEKKQITAFIVETNNPGFEVAFRCQFMGLHAVELGIIKFNNFKVPAENILGGLGEGLKLALNTLNTGRLTLPAASTGMSKWCLAVARKWAKERKQWGSSIGEHEAIATKLAFIASHTLALEAITWLTSHFADAKKVDIRLEAAMAKLFSTEVSWQIVDETLQIRGGRGFETASSLKGRGEKGFAVERAFRDSRVNRIIEGTTQIMHLFIAREALDPHLRRITPILGRGSIFDKLMAALLAGWHYLFWYLKISLPTFTFGEGKDLPKIFRKHLLFVKKTTKRLAKTIFGKMLIYQKGLEGRQNILRRIVEIGTDLFVMSTVCSYAAKKPEAFELADLFCQQAKSRIAQNFRDLRFNADKSSRKVAKKVLAGDYSWLESDIIFLEN